MTNYKLDTALIILLLIVTVANFYLYISISIDNAKIIQDNEDLKYKFASLQAKILTQDNLSDSTVAQYLPSTETIVLYTIKDDTLNETEKNFYHELGHKVWYEYMSDEQRDEYLFLFNQTTDFISEYAKTSEKEDFAENYAQFRLNNTINQIKYLFIEDLT